VVVTDDDTLFVWILKDGITMINRKTKATQIIIKNKKSFYSNTLMKILDFHKDTFPFLLVKDKDKVFTINTKSHEYAEIAKVQFDANGIF
jgi:hypothetical protein